VCIPCSGGTYRLTQLRARERPPGRCGSMRERQVAKGGNGERGYAGERRSWAYHVSRVLTSTARCGLTGDRRAHTGTYNTNIHPMASETRGVGEEKKQEREGNALVSAGDRRRK
jgi:hypothetical protein